MLVGPLEKEWMLAFGDPCELRLRLFRYCVFRLTSLLACLV